MARLDDQKGHRHLIDAIAILASAANATRRLLAGEGRAQRIACAPNARRWGLGGARAIPRLPAATSGACLEAADIVVLPSLYEGLPLVAIEALAAGRPMVATEVDGTPEVVIHERTGLLVPPANPVALAAAIERLLDEPGLAARLASDGTKRIRA